MADFDPYRPPGVDTEGPVGGSGEPLYTTQHVTLATFFGTPLAGFILLGINERRMGRPEKLPMMIGLGVLATMIVTAVSWVLPDQVPAFVVSLACVLGMQALAKQWQGDEVMERLSNGAPKASGWHAFGIGLICLVCFVAVAFGIGYTFPEWFV